MGELIRLPVKVASPDPEDGFCRVPVCFEAQAGAVGFTLGKGDEAQEVWLPTAQAKQWRDLLSTMIDTAEAMEGDCG